MPVQLEPTPKSGTAPSNIATAAHAPGRAYRDRLLRLADVRFMTGLGKSSIYAAIAEGTFPAAVNVTGYAVAWRESEVDAWIASRTKHSPATPIKTVEQSVAEVKKLMTADISSKTNRSRP